MRKIIFGQGKTYNYNDTNAKVTDTEYKTTNAFTITIEAFDVSPDDDDDNNNWDLWMIGPKKGKTDASRLKRGLYDDAQRFGFQDDDKPGLSFFGHGRICNTVCGKFEIYEVEYNDEGRVATLSASFEQHCECGKPRLVGLIDYKTATTTTKSLVSTAD